MTDRESMLPARRADRLARQVMSNEEAAEVVADFGEAIAALQLCLHLLAGDGYLDDPDYPEVREAMALYERLVEA